MADYCNQIPTFNLIMYFKAQ